AFRPTVTLREFLGCPHLARLRSLDIEALPGGDVGVRAVAGASNLKQLTHLSLCHTMGSRLLPYSGQPLVVTGESLNALLQSPNFGVVRRLYLDLMGNLEEDHCLEILAAWPGLDRLRQLEVYANFTDRGIQALARSPYTTHLRRLALGWLPSCPGVS